MRRLKFSDESGVNLAMTRLYGRAPRGERVLDAVPRNHGPNVTMVGALGMQGMTAVMPGEGATEAHVFFADIEPVLAPTLQPGDIVVMDNLRVQKVADVPSAIRARGAHVRYWPPSSPDLSPIEPCWSKLKTSLRKAKARTREALDTAMTEA